MGVLVVAALAGCAWATMILLGVRRLLWTATGAALVLGATGYVLQGRPFLPGSSPRPAADRAADDPASIDLRTRMLGQFSADSTYLVAADAMQRAGDSRAAARVILAGIRKLPQSMILWIGLGDALATHDHALSPPALFAYRQAIRLFPHHPVPFFFLGLAHVRANQMAEARPLWAKALELTPVDISYRRDIAVRLFVLDRYLAAQDRSN